MADIESIEELRRLAVSGFEDWQSLGMVRVAAEGELLQFSYTTEAQYAGRWNYFERVSRGLILHRATGEVVARPFDKFFNWMERGAKASGSIVSITEKVDGSLGILYRAPGGYRVATRGAFRSEQAEWATARLRERHPLPGLPEELTLLFEIVYPQNRIVLDYGARAELVLLAARNRHTGDYLPFFPDVRELARRYGFATPKTYSFEDVQQILETLGTLGGEEEGYVVEFSDGARFKFKGERYLELHKLIYGLSFKSVLEAIAGGSIGKLRAELPDEFMAQVDEWTAQIEATVAAKLSSVEALFEQAPRASRKEFALWARQHPEAPYLFAKLDGRPIEPMVYRLEF